MNYAIILSGGTGSRMGSEIPKQYLTVHGKMLIYYTTDTICKNKDIDGFVIVAAKEWQDAIGKMLATEINPGDKFLGFALPGANRQLSIYQGLLFLHDKAKDEDVVLVQDAARPNTSQELISQCVALLESEDGRMPVLSMKDTIYYSRNGATVEKLLEREALFAGQAPEAFRFGKYLVANEALLPEEILRINGSSEPAILAKQNISMIPGEEGNFKVTTKEDLLRFEQICKNT